MTALARVSAPDIPTERQVQRSILSMCGTCFRDVFVTAIPNGAHLAGDAQARFKQMGAMKGDGLKVGMPDLLVLWKGGGCFIEVKRPKTGKLSIDQMAIHLVLQSMEWPVATVTSDQEAYDFLVKCGAPCSAKIRTEPF